MHDYDPLIRLVHQFFQAAGFILLSENVIFHKRYAMTYGQPYNGPDHLRWFAGPDLGNYRKEQLEKDQGAQPVVTVVKGRGAGADLEEMHEKKTVHGAEPAVMDTEKRDDEQFSQVVCSLVHFQDCHFQNVVETGNKVFNPVEQNDEPDIPVKEENADKGNEIRTD
jgi:hypothetical protein